MQMVTFARIWKKGWKNSRQRSESNRSGVLRELRNVGYANMADFVTFGPHGVTLKNSEDLTRNQLAAVSQVTETITNHGGTKTIKLHGKVEALSKLGQNLRLFDEDKLEDLKIAVQVVNVR